MSLTTFDYRAYNQQGGIDSGQLNAESEKEVVDVLKSRQLFPVEITVSQSKGNDKNVQEKLSTAELIDFTQALTTLIKSRIPIDKALILLKDLSSRKSTAQIIETLKRDVKEGKTLAQAMDKYPQSFSKLYVNMVKAGEEGGILDILLPSLNDFLVANQETKKQLISALIYPAVLFVVGILSIILMLAFVVPQFAGLFEDAGSAIPASAKFLLSLSDFTINYGWLLFLIPIFVFVLWKKISSDVTLQYKFDHVFLKLPIIGQIIIEKEAMIFSQTLGSLLKAGIPLFKSLTITGGVVNNKVFIEQLEKIKTEVTTGMSLGRALAKHSQFPILVSKLVTVGEETGRTSEILIQLSQDFNKSVKDKMNKLVTLAEPFLILVLGILVGGIVITMLSAVFSINDMGL